MPAPHYAMSALQEVRATGVTLGNQPLVSAPSKVVKLASSLVFSSLALYETALIFIPIQRSILQSIELVLAETGKRSRFYIDVYCNLSRDRYAGVA